MTRDQCLRWSRTLARTLFFPALCLVIWGQLQHGVEMPAPEGSDKILHFTAYLGLAGMAAVALNGARKHTLIAVLALIALGGAMEIVQGLIGRDAEFLDEVANTIGALCGWGAGIVWTRLTGAISFARD